MEESGAEHCGHCQCQRSAHLNRPTKKNMTISMLWLTLNPYCVTLLRGRTAGVPQSKNNSPYQQRAVWRWWWADRLHARGCSLSWCWRWEACCDRMASSSAETLWEVLSPGPEMQKYPWSGSPTTSALLSGESPGEMEQKMLLRTNNNNHRLKLINNQYFSNCNWCFLRHVYSII